MPWEELGKSKVSIDQSNPGISNAVALTGSLENYVTGSLPVSLSRNVNRPLYMVGELEKLTIPTSDGTGQCVHPSVVYLPEGFGGYKYWMAMTPYPNLNYETEFPEIVASNDGVTWEVPEGITNPIDTDDSFMPDPSLVYDSPNKQLVVYYTSHDSGGTTYRKTISSSRVVSERVATNVCLSGACVLRLRGEWISFNVNATDYEYPQIVRRFSADGINWSDKYDVGSNLRGGFSHVMAYHDGAGFHFLISAGPRDENVPYRQLHYGYSEYGDYVIFDSAPIVLPDPDKWYSGTIYTSCLCQGATDQTLNMYVSAFGIDKTVYIGLVPVKFGNLIDLAWQSSKRRQIVLFDKIEIRDTASHHYGNTANKSIVGFNDYPNKTLAIHNTLNKSIDLYFTTKLRGAIDALYFDVSRTQQKITISNIGGTVITSKELECLSGEFAGAVNVSVKATSEAPTSGSLTVVLTMWR